MITTQVSNKGFVLWLVTINYSNKYDKRHHTLNGSLELHEPHYWLHMCKTL